MDEKTINGARDSLDKDKQLGAREQAQSALAAEGNRIFNINVKSKTGSKPDDYPFAIFMDINDDSSDRGTVYDDAVELHNKSKGKREQNDADSAIARA